MVVWECEVGDPHALSEKLRIFLGDASLPSSHLLSTGYNE